MACKQLIEVLKCLEKSENNAEFDAVLPDTFNYCLKLFDLIQESDIPSNSDEYQDAVNKGIKALERCTKMVNELDLFSSNETITEVQTSSIKYLVLPTLLGSLSLLVNKKEMSQKLENLTIAEVYFKDFLLRCRNYELCPPGILGESDDPFEDDSTKAKKSSVLSTADLAATRERKIQRYKSLKALKEKEANLKEFLNRSDAEEQIREYYITFLERWMISAVEELENIKREKVLLESMIHRKESDENNEENQRPLNVQPLKPFIITRNEVQKKVFGMGYPSLPVMTIGDFYQQRFEKQIQEQKSTGKSLQERALTGNFNDNEEEIKKEELLDKDDPVAIKKARDWDDWKDDNPRGSGNRKNKG